MPQLYGQVASRPDPWLVGRTSAGLCTLQTACPLTVTYSGGSPAADTIAAGSVATVYGGSAAAFDASADVWVVLTVPASGALQVVKEADLAAVTGDWAGLARIVQHSVEPYQPSAYLAAGGGGTVTSTTYPAIVSGPGLERVLSTPDATLSSEPATWWLPAFDDSGWAGSIVSGTPGDPSVSWGEITLPDGAVSITDVDNNRVNGVYLFVRRTFSLPAAPILSATLVVAPDSYVDEVWVNGTSVWSEVGLDNTTNLTYEDVTETIPIGSYLIPGATNLLAIRDRNGWSGGIHNPVRVVYHLSVTVNAGGGVPAPPGSASEGDLLYYHSGLWARLPVGTSGQELTVVAGDPAWTDQPADVDTSGTVTSVAFSGPTGTTTGGSPITTSGTISLSWASQSASTFLGAPSGSSGAPTFRALVGADIPVDASTIVVSSGTIKGNYQAGSGVSISGNTISATGSGGSVTSVALTVPGIFSVSGSPVTTSGTLAVSLATQSAHTVFAGPASGSAATPTFRSLQSSDLPAAAGAGGKIHAHGHFT